jgi:hypothetical protein
MAIARSDGSLSIHSIAIEPAPAPISHNISPRRGASDEIVSARTSRLVIWPSCSNSASGRPGARAITRAPGAATTSTATVLSGSTLLKSKFAAVLLRICSRGPPNASSTVIREAPKPLSTSRSASVAGPSLSEVNASTRAPGCRCGRTRSSARPCNDRSAVSGSAQPSRAAARLNADGAGTTSMSRASTWRASREPTP